MAQWSSTRIRIACSTKYWVALSALVVRGSIRTGASHADDTCLHGSLSSLKTKHLKTNGGKIILFSDHLEKLNIWSKHDMLLHNYACQTIIFFLSSKHTARVEHKIILSQCLDLGIWTMETLTVKVSKDIYLGQNSINTSTVFRQDLSTTALHERTFEHFSP